MAGVLDTDPITYKIQDLSGKVISGTLYEPKLVRFDKQDEVYRIEEVIRKEGDKYLVKWLGYPEKFNSWVSSP